MRSARGATLIGCLCAVLAGCSGPRSGVSVTSGVDACAAALPVARAAVHNHGKLVRVRALRHGDLLQVAEQLGLPPPPSSPSPPRSGVLPPVTTKPKGGGPSSPASSAQLATVSGTPLLSGTPIMSGTSLPPEPEPRGCLVVLQAGSGRYRAATVDHPIGAPRGRYAIALVKLHKARLIVVILTDALPKPLQE